MSNRTLTNCPALGENHMVLARAIEAKRWNQLSNCTTIKSVSFISKRVCINLYNKFHDIKIYSAESLHAIVNSFFGVKNVVQFNRLIELFDVAKIRVSPNVSLQFTCKEINQIWSFPFFVSIEALQSYVLFYKRINIVFWRQVQVIKL